MKSELALGVAALLCIGATSTAPANAVTYLYEINASYQLGPANSITGSFTMDDGVGPASISNVDIHATLPTTAGSINFSFDQVISPVDTWNAFGGSSPYLSFANAFSAGSTYFWMGVRYDTNSNDGSYLIGIWGNPGNPHPSEISSLNPVGNWQGITGRMTREIAPSVPEASTGAMLLLGFAGVGFLAYRRKSRVPSKRLLARAA